MIIVNPRFSHCIKKKGRISANAPIYKLFGRGFSRLRKYSLLGILHWLYITHAIRVLYDSANLIINPSRMAMPYMTQWGHIVGCYSLPLNVHYVDCGPTTIR